MKVLRTIVSIGDNLFICPVSKDPSYEGHSLSVKSIVRVLTSKEKMCMCTKYAPFSNIVSQYRCQNLGTLSGTRDFLVAIN